MEGKRFGVGLTAGLLLGLAVIVASSGFGTGQLYGTFGPAAPYRAGSVATSSTVTEAATTTTQSSYPVAGLTGNLTVSQGSATITTTTQGSVAFGNSTGKSVNQANALSSLSSNVDNIPRQPLISNAVIFIPVFVAFVLGAALYRASRLGNEERS
jgi:hypothetical protein